MHVNDLMRQIAMKYANCQTYQDKGRVEGPQGAMTFSTYFVRPNRFRCEWIYLDLESASGSIWSDGLNVFAHYGCSEALEEEPSLGVAIAGGTGVSQGVAHTVSSLLMPDIESALNSRTLLKLAPYELRESEVENDERCHRVRSTRTNNQDDLWIRMSDYAIVNLTEESTSPPEDDEETIAAVYDVDPALAEEMRNYLATCTERDRHGIVCTHYDTVIFDQFVDDAVFKNPAK